MGPVAGGKLDGEPTPWPNDWTFTDEFENVLLQTDPEDPYSVTLWGVAVEDQFFIAGQSRDSRWCKKILEDARVVVSVQGQLYSGLAYEETNPEVLQRVLDAYITKYDFDIDELDEDDDGIVFQLHRPD